MGAVVIGGAILLGIGAVGYVIYKETHTPVTHASPDGGTQ
jgi:hypothetical protein